MLIICLYIKYFYYISCMKTKEKNMKAKEKIKGRLALDPKAKTYKVIWIEMDEWNEPEFFEEIFKSYNEAKKCFDNLNQ